MPPTAAPRCWPPSSTGIANAARVLGAAVTGLAVFSPIALMMAVAVWG